MNNLIFTLIERGFGWNLVRNIFASLDLVAYKLLEMVMGLIFDVAQVAADPSLNGMFQGVHDRIYTILSIYMLFKVTVSVLTYIINPDSMTDKSQGVSKLVTRIIITLVMLIFFPIGFNKLYDIQSDILRDHTIDNIILGSESITANQDENRGGLIGYSIYNGFAISENGEKIEGEGIDTVEQLVNIVNAPESESNKSEYKYTYYPLIGFAVGIVMVIVMLGICIDVAMRTFKLIILQFLAPIPIISYVDPKASKDGAFSKWIKMVISTWIDLFVRLAIIDFILLVIQKMVIEGGLANVASNNSIMVNIALIIGLLFFAKNAPKFIYESLGMKAPERGLFAGLGSIAAAGAIGAGAISGGIAGFSASRLADTANNVPHNGLNTLKNVGAGLFGAAGGVTTGIGAAANAKDHNARAVMEAMSKRNDAAIAAGAAGSTALGRAMSMGSRVLTGQTAAMRMDRSIAKMQAQKDALSNIKSRISGEMVKQRWTQGDLGIEKDNANNSIGMVNYKDFMAAKNAAAAAGSSTVDFKDVNGVSHTISMEQAELQSGFLLKNNEDDYIKRATGEVRDSSGAVVFSGDDTLNGLIDIATEAGATVSDRKSVTTVVDELGIAITNAKNANETNKQNDRFAGKK